MTTKTTASAAEGTIGKRIKQRVFVGLALGAFALSAQPAVAQAASTSALERDAFLRAVAQVETGGNARAVGRLGERGLYQFTRATWQYHSSRPFVEAHHPAVAYQVAVKHFEWLQKRIAARGLEATPFRMAVAWNAGLSRAVAGTPPRSTRDYARRVTNLVGLYRVPVAGGALVQTASVNAPAPRVQTVVSLAFLSSMPDAEIVPEVNPISFSLGGIVASGVEMDAPEVAAIEPEREISFTLANPAASSEGSSSANPPRRLIFATIGE